MIGEYTFKINGLDCDPAYSDDLKLEYTLQQDAFYYRKALVGELTFVRDDYDYIMSRPFDTRFNVDVYNNGVLFFSGYFARTDCKENIDDRNIKVQLNSTDAYDAILNNFDTAYNILDLGIKLEHILIDKRPAIQVYALGDEVVSVFLRDIFWEQPVNTKVTSHTALINTYHFSYYGMACDAVISQSPVSAINGRYLGVGSRGTNTNNLYALDWSWDVGNTVGRYLLVRLSDSTILYHSDWFDPSEQVSAFDLYDFSDNFGGRVEGRITFMYMRALCDVTMVGSLATYPLPANDITQNGLNYSRAIGYNFDNALAISTEESTTPTKYGRTNSLNYFAEMTNMYGDKFFPVARSSWINSSIWFTFRGGGFIVDEAARRTFLLRDAYVLSSVIDKLLKQINSDYYFSESNSQFLYSSTPIKRDGTRLFLTQKTNILKGNYDKPAQKAEVSLKQILDMLSAVYSCRWHMEGNALHIEHISYYKKGRTYLSTDIVGMDLTAETHVRHYKPYTFQKNSFTYDKEALPEKIIYKYGDNTTEIFNGRPIKVISSFVEKGKTQEINAGNFNADVDYMLLNPSDVSNDGFALLAARLINNTNLIDKNSQYYAINTKLNANGVLIQADGFTTSGYISVNPGVIYSTNYNCEMGGWFNFVGDFIASFTNSINGVTAPPEATYARVSFNSTYTDFAFIQGNSPQSYKLPYIDITVDGVDYSLQNGYLSFASLIPAFHTHDLPAYNVEINGVQFSGPVHLRKTKKQSLWVNSLSDPEPYRLVKTNIGNGLIEKMSINLISRRVDLSLTYDTY